MKRTPTLKKDKRLLVSVQRIQELQTDVLRDVAGGGAACCRTMGTGCANTQPAGNE